MVNKELANYIVPMSEQFPNHINVYKPDVSFFINRIKNNEPFSFIKLNHAFWELVIEVEKDLFKFEPYINDSLLKGLFPQERASDPVGWLKLHGFDLYYDLIDIVSNINQSNIFLGVSHIGPPDEKLFVGKQEYLSRLNCIVDKLPSNYIPFFGPIWKYYAIENKMNDFFNALNDFQIVFIGLKHVDNIGKELNLKHQFIELDLTATKKRFELLDYFLNTWKKDTFWIFQAGESLSAWFIHHMNLKLNDFWGVDLGRSLDLILSKKALNIDEKSLPILPDFYNQKWMQK